LCLLKELFVNETVNVGSDVEIDINELAKLVQAIVNPNAEISRLPALAEGDMRRRKPDNSKMMTTLGRELLPLSEGISRTAEFLRTKPTISV
jgi:UDP-glucose 4-epimerase